MSHARTVELSWAGRVRTGNKKVFEYAKDYEVICRFKEILSREGIYKEVQKANWPFTKIVGMVLRPGGLVDFTLKSKDLALKFAKTLNELESVKTATAHADTVVEVRIDFIPPGFPSEPILEYLTQNHGEILETPIRISDRYNIQTGTRVFKMDREKLEQNPIPSYLYFGKYKFRTRYQGQHTTCGYCAETDHIERECPKKANMKILVKKVKMQRRVATTPNESDSEIEGEPSLTYDEAAESFERKDARNPKQQSQTIATPKEDQQKKETSKRPLSDSSNTPPLTQPQKKTNSAIDKELSELFELDQEINSNSSTEDYDLKSLTDPCCYEQIQKCTGRYFVCACERQYYKCKCGWKTIGREKGAYKCDNCHEIVANCVSCGSFQVKKKGKLSQCESCLCQLTKELHRSITF